ncbi:TonB family protein [uncultured Erythrobacter sp.]|uniref:TonB family protein n=1 Tax=uncultured Erythrobacter sp. TaxID=263913 RepID=UPI00261FFE0D|nr:TonB family protein [uncultured Erythrobacter sp.]
MRVRLFFALTAASVGLTAAPASADDPTDTLLPSSPWNVDFGETKCRLARFFGEGDDRHLIFFEQSGPANGLGLTVSGKRLKRFRSLRRTSVRFFDEQKPKRTKPFKGDVEGYGPALIFSSMNVRGGTDDSSKKESASGALPQLDPVRGDRVKYIALQQGSQKVRLQTGPLGETFKVMNKCTQNMVRDWGLDVDKHLTAKRMPELKNLAFVSSRIEARYPRRALNKGEQGIFKMRVIVDETGKVTECVVNNATIQDALESPACKTMVQAEFEPALDADGNPFRSYHTTTITYRMN